MRSSGSEPVDACGQSSMDLNGSRRNPGGDIVERRWCWAPEGSNLRHDLVSSVFVLVFGHFSALGVNFFD